jgi:serine/threonine protein kinase/Flp pilus assembly protein TadD
MTSLSITDLSVEPSALGRLSESQKRRLTELLDRYLSALENDTPLDKDALLAAHPDLAEPLRAYLENLEELHDVAAGFAGGSRDDLSVESAPTDQRRLGDFRLLREIGRGGMGVVYEAQQISLGRRVALKVLPFAAVLDAKQIARFKNEAQATAQLNHPNIVSVFAVGVDRGVHYYAMQYIDGQPLDRAIAEMRSGRPDCGPPKTMRAPDSTLSYCPENLAEHATPRPGLASTCRTLPALKSGGFSEYCRTVVGLGIQAAEALHAAHEYGVVHRDIKPSNLLLDADGKLWVTDFGLARCLTDRTLTRTGDVVGTMRYMSPEQALGQSALVDQRTDVYSLGATLYELLALRPAFAGDDAASLLRRIDQDEPRRLRQLDPRIPVDMETVVAKAMSKHRDDRYTTARQLADDLHRILDGKPIAARPPSLLDRASHWTRRHFRMVLVFAAAGLVAGLCMTVAIILVTQAKVKAESERSQAETNSQLAWKAVDFFGADAARMLADVPGAQSVRRKILENTLCFYRQFVEQARDNAKLRRELAETHGKIGDVARALGSSAEAIEAYSNARKVYEQLVAENPSEPKLRQHLSLCLSNLAFTLRSCGRSDEARRVLLNAIDLQKHRLADVADDPEAMAGLALAHTNLGLLQSDTNQAQAAEASIREAIQLQQRLVDSKPDNPEYLRSLAATWNNLSALYLVEDPTRAGESYRKALDYQIKAAAARPNDPKYQSDVARTYNNLGRLHARENRLADAATYYDEAIKIQRQIARADPSQKSYREDLAVSLNNLGMTQARLRRTLEAEKAFRDALELQETLAAQDPRNVDLQSSLGGINNNLGMVLEELHRDADAAESYHQAIEHQQAAMNGAPQVSTYRTFLSKHYYNYGRILRSLGRPGEAATVALERRDLWPDDPRHLATVAEELDLAAKALQGSSQGGFTAQQCEAQVKATLQLADAARAKLPDQRDRSTAASSDEGHSDRPVEN